MIESIEIKSHIIRLGKYEDIPAILEFIKTEWNSNHIFVRNREFFEYEHYIDGRINGLLAINKDAGTIDGILLFYQTQKQLEGSDFFGGIWCVAKSCKIPMLGYKLVDSVQKLTGIRGHSGVGINPTTTANVFKHIRGQHVGKLKHFYRLSERKEYEIASVVKKEIIQVKDEGAVLIELLDIDELKAVFNLERYRNQYPFKDLWYIEKRYYNHPIYDYKVFGIKSDDEITGILVTRLITIDQRRVWRIIDVLGDADVLKLVGNSIEEKLQLFDCEYVDIYEIGISNETMYMAGFSELKEDDENIIPNHFEPFEKRNIDLWYHTPYDFYHIYKGDGDQDRPNFC